MDCEFNHDEGKEKNALVSNNQQTIHRNDGIVNKRKTYRQNL